MDCCVLYPGFAIVILDMMHLEVSCAHRALFNSKACRALTIVLLKTAMS